ncbi:preprotein translocase subunit YajC [Novosphingobium sp. FKTRR1]|uniref:preprotein translocase subunit YajC n=1 Tax=Novosphingobium sp. FKTRR1 TaxID=2879118 RepID=UPI001CF07128|nr:preprotein translocase subunit YajC [Novosphingobium sp. FKTRR1]
MNGPAMLSLLSTAYAQTVGGGAPAEAPAYLQFLPLVAMAAIFYFLILRPQMRKQKEHQVKIAALKKGDEVVTAGGIIGKVIKVEDHVAEIEIAPNVRVKAVKSTLGEVVAPGGNAAAAND